MNELIDFANWLWDMDKLKINTQLPPFETAEDLVKYYKKVKNLTIHGVIEKLPPELDDMDYFYGGNFL